MCITSRARGVVDASWTRRGRVECGANARGWMPRQRPVARPRAPRTVRARRRDAEDERDDVERSFDGDVRGRDGALPIAVFEETDHEATLRRAVKKAIVEAEYECILDVLQHELVTFQDYVRAKGKKVVILFEGRDAAGKGGCIARITEVLSARCCRVVALGAPTEQEKTQWYFQKYVCHLPSAGHIVIFDRSWYNRSGVERVMGFATPEQVEQFEREVNVFEKMLVDSGITLIKLWFDVGPDEQERRFRGRLQDADKRWKLSPMDMFARSKFYEYTKARDLMFQNTSETVPWSIVPADDKRVARLNAIQHILSSVDYSEVAQEKLELPKLQEKPKHFVDADLTKFDPRKARIVPQVYTTESLSVRDIDGKTWESIAKDAAKRVKKSVSLDSMDDGDSSENTNAR